MAALGYNPGAADGRWGPRTATAYATFLRDAGPAAGERVDPGRPARHTRRSQGSERDRISGASTQGPPHARAQLGMAAHHLLEHADRADAQRVLENRHDVRFEGVGQRV